jgi:hypothetical protein
MIAVLMSGLAGLVFFQVNQRWQLAIYFESQLHSQVLAGNGVEYARHLLPYLDIPELLLGPDGSPCSTQESEWRNPISFENAQRLSLREWASGCDDGLPIHPSVDLGNSDGSGFKIRFSNNPEEDRYRDQDHILIVRSMGIVPGGASVFAPEIRNCVTLLEARLRQERLFQLPSPLVVLGDGVECIFLGTGFLVDGTAEHAAVTVVGLSGPGPVQDLLAGLSDEQRYLVRGRGQYESVEDGREEYSSAFYARLFQVTFWRHFNQRIADFADLPTPSTEERGLYFLPHGGVLEGSYRGMLIARGDLTLHANARIEGLLIHLGGGRLTLTENSKVGGGVWLSNLDDSTDELRSGDVSLEISGSTEIRFDFQAIQRALQVLPATQMGWRMVFPEMIPDSGH